MAPRARIPLLCVYALLAACGMISIFTPVESVASAAIPILVKVWGVFFFVGGVIAFGALATRMVQTAALGWWYIEISGIILLATSALIYSSVLIMLVWTTHSLGLAGLTCLILGLACSLIGRAIDALRIARLERKILDELTQRDRRV